MEGWRSVDHRAARLVRVAGLACGGLSLAALSVFVLLPMLGRGFIRGLGLVVTGCVWLATSVGTGVSLWDVLWTIVRAAAGGLATPAASAMLAVLVLVGVVALYVLQRLLDKEEEES